MDGTYFSFPFTQIGEALRNLSMSGSIGNAVVWVIYVLVGAAFDSVLCTYLVLLVLGIWILAEYVRGNRKLKQENDLFI